MYIAKLNIHIYFFRFFSLIGYNKILNIVKKKKKKVYQAMKRHGENLSNITK